MLSRELKARDSFGDKALDGRGEMRSINTSLEETGCEGLYWMCLAQEQVQWLAVLNAVFLRNLLVF